MEINHVHSRPYHRFVPLVRRSRLYHCRRRLRGTIALKYYVSRTHVSLDADGRISGYETVLTRPAPIKATLEALRRYKAIGITSIHLCEHPANSRRYGKLDRGAVKRRGKARKLTVADVAPALAELAAEDDKS